MLWSIPIARIAGTVVRVHVTFLLFLVWIGGSSWRAGGREAAWESVTFMVLLFGCVLAHEFGHIVAARRYADRAVGVLGLAVAGYCVLAAIPYPTLLFVAVYLGLASLAVLRAGWVE